MLALTAAVPAVILAAKLDDALRTFVLVVVTFVPTEARVVPSDELAFRTLVFVVASFATAEARVAPSELDAFVTSDCTAREPEVSPEPVRVRVAALQISAAMDTPDVRVLVVYAQTEAGIERIEAARELDALRTFVLAVVTFVATPPIEAPSDELAFKTFVFAVFTFVFTEASVAPSELEALRTLVFVVFTFVPTEASVEPSDVDAALVFALTAAVLAVIAEAKLEEALVTSACKANDPEERLASVRSRTL